jgi:histone deacetylase 1/2
MQSECIRAKIIDHLRNMPHAPSVQMQDVPRDEEDDEEKEEPDVRITGMLYHIDYC